MSKRFMFLDLYNYLLYKINNHNYDNPTHLVHDVNLTHDLYVYLNENN